MRSEKEIRKKRFAPEENIDRYWELEAERAYVEGFRDAVKIFRRWVLNDKGEKVGGEKPECFYRSGVEIGQCAICPWLHECSIQKVGGEKDV